MKRKPIAAASIAGVLAALVLGTAVAFAAATVTLDPTATLIDREAAVNVPVQVSCDPGSADNFRNVFVEVNQAVEDGVAKGAASTDQFSCDGTQQTVNMLVRADSSGRPFREGVAFAKAELTVCSIQACEFTNEQREIGIARP